MVAFLRPCFHAENDTRRSAVAYCTFSSDDYRCDVLAAALVNGYQIVVGWRRINGDVPKTEHLDVEGMETEYEEACRRQVAFVSNAEYELIDLPYAGDTFRFNEFEDFAEKMNELYDLGYRIPEEVMAEMDLLPPHLPQGVGPDGTSSPTTSGRMRSYASLM